MNYCRNQISYKRTAAGYLVLRQNRHAHLSILLTGQLSYCQQGVHFLSPNDDASEAAEASTWMTAGGAGAKLTRDASAETSCTSGSCCEILTDFFSGASFLPMDSLCAILRPMLRSPASTITVNRSFIHCGTVGCDKIPHKHNDARSWSCRKDLLCTSIWCCAIEVSRLQAQTAREAQVYELLEVAKGTNTGAYQST